MPTTQILRTVKDFARLVPSPLRHISPVTHNSHCELWPSVRPRILFVVELAIAEMACVSRNIPRTFHVPSGVPVQRSISERDCSHPLVEFVFAEIASTSQTIRTSFLTMLALVWSSGRFLPAKTHILYS